ncbi:MAG: SurA N-terminal domain-containing protein [Elusimicrobia bacterium]|nr:SurA N-terminal domain-containing protein [Elusimicrobiota bacterium]MDE2236751.1 SurA N-terminal domain-containing protein [Elusimicrobiota bacterium]MDE2426108.1 SurA N-terminal domain-containing protein [Elusimicrobiota bacterium]
MMAFLRRYKTACFVAVIVIFLLGTFVGLGGYLFTSRDMSEAVASVGRQKIPYGEFVDRVNQYTDALRARGTDVTDEMTKRIKQGVLRDLIVDELLRQRADAMGLVVTDEELANDIQNTPAFQRGGQFDQQLYFARVRQDLHETPETYERERRTAIKAAMVKQLIYHAAKLTPAELTEEYKEAHKGSMKGFDKQKADFAAKAQQRRALELINFYLRQLAQKVEIRTYLQQRESGA